MRGVSEARFGSLVARDVLAVSHDAADLTSGFWVVVLTMPLSGLVPTGRRSRASFAWIMGYRLKSPPSWNVRGWRVMPLTPLSWVARSEARAATIAG